MACFTVPAAEAIITTVAKKIVKNIVKLLTNEIDTLPDSLQIVDHAPV